MGLSSILLIVAAALIGAVVMFFAMKNKYSGSAVGEPNSAQLIQAQTTVSELTAQKEKAEKLLAEARQEVVALDEQLKSVISGGTINPDLAQKFADADKLKKKIKSLEAELEETEDDLEDTEKKLKNKTTELSDVKQQRDQLEADLRKIRQELEEIRSDLNQKEEQLKLKIESLSFVQSILSAVEVNSSSINDLYKKIDDVSGFFEDEILYYIGQLYDVKDQIVEQKENLIKWEVTKKKSWIAGKTAIAFVGEFSAGKTSIVNRILSQDDPNVHRLPVSAKATTAIPTYISGGVKTEYHFFTPDNKLKVISEEAFHRVTKEVLEQVDGVSNLIQYFVMSYKNKNLDNLSILDTPGFNSTDSEDAARTLEVINECDALFWVFDVNAGTVNKSSLELIKNNLKKPLYVVINKVDTKAKTEVDKVEALIRDTFNRENVSVEAFIRFSSQEPLENLMKCIRQVERTDEAGNFIISAKEWVERYIKYKEEETREKKNDFDQYQTIANDCIDRYNQAVNTLLNNCETAASLPQYNSRWFSEDDYKMSQGQYNRLINLLNEICNDRVNEMINLYNEQMDNLSNLQNAYGIWKEAEFQAKQLVNLLTRWKKLIKRTEY